MYHITNNKHSGNKKVAFTKLGKVNGGSLKSNGAELQDLLIESQQEIIALRKRNAMLQGKIAEQNDRHEKEKHVLTVELATCQELLDVSETLDVASFHVLLPLTMEKAEIPAEDRKQIKTFVCLDGYIQLHPNGRAMYDKLPSAIKEVGGPALSVS